MITVVLIGTRKSGNLGAIARVMKNFGFSTLILIDPVCKVGSVESKKRAKHAQDVLNGLKVKPISCLKKFDVVVGTTGKLGTDYNIPRSPIVPEKLGSVLKSRKGGKNVALVFGSEGTGLTNEQVALCDFMVTIPTSRVYPVLNLSHAVGVVLYELSKVFLDSTVDDHIVESTQLEKKQLMKMVLNHLDTLEFSTKEKKETQVTVWKRLLGKSFLTKREAFALMGFFRKIDLRRKP